VEAFLNSLLEDIDHFSRNSIVIKASAPLYKKSSGELGVSLALGLHYRIEYFLESHIIQRQQTRMSLIPAAVLRYLETSEDTD
jgi:hypothetical protein